MLIRSQAWLVPVFAPFRHLTGKGRQGSVAEICRENPRSGQKGR